MYKYEYVTVNYDLSVVSRKLTEHKDIIDRYAKNGWRFVGAVPTVYGPNAYLSKADLVFEKEENDK